MTVIDRTQDEIQMGRPKSSKPDEGSGIAVRGSKAWRDWVNELADFRRLKMTDLIDQSLVEYAERHGFKKRAPKR
jgi:hypothetical protein